MVEERAGGWITIPFIIGSFICLTLACGGWYSNLLIYLIKEFNIKKINATLIANLVCGCTFIFPVGGAVIADSFLGSFIVISISSCISLLGLVSLTLTATIESLRPQPCDNNGTNICESPSKLQYSILFFGITLACIGVGGTRFTIATFGANQFKNAKHKNIFFNWFTFAFFASMAFSWTVIVYIEDNVSFGLGFGISIAANIIGLVIFLSGNCFYLHHKPQGSPFTALARVLVASLRKRFVQTSSPTTNNSYYYDKMVFTTPTNSFRYLNRAALIREGDINLDGSNAKPWRLCRVEEVEDFKSLLRLLPLWLAIILLSIPIPILLNLVVLQALTMNRHLGPNFIIPPSSFAVIALISVNIFLPLINKFLYPLWQKFIEKPMTPLQRIGLGNVLLVLSMAVSALVESKRLKISHHLDGETREPMLSLWLFPQLVLVGVGDAFRFPAQIGLYYQEFPVTLRSTATSMNSMAMAIAFYLSSALIGLIHATTRWLPDDINEGRLDYVYWVIFLIGLLSFCSYLVCAKWYKYQNVEKNDTI